MTPNDPRHGHPAGYRAGCHGPCCRRAIAAYNERRRLAVLEGTWDRAPRPAIGVQRRLQALMVLGWSIPRIAAELDTDPAYARYLLHESTRVSARTHQRVAEVYDRLSMRHPSETTQGERQGATRSRNYAAQQGWLPPLAWDDIDHDPTPAYAVDRGLVDDVVVRRILDGDPTPARAATAAERRAVVAAWPTTGRSLADLERLTGWKAERYATRASETGAAA